MIAIKISGNAIQVLRHANETVKHPRALMADVGRRVANELRKHFRDLNSENPNKLGGKRTNFWNDVRNSVLDAVATDNSATITIAHPAILQKLYGGIIRAINSMFLAIPARTEAYGKSPRLFNDLRFAVLNPGGPALIQADKTSLSVSKRKRKDGSYSYKTKQGTEAGGGVFYWLRREVTQAAFPDTLPKDSEFSDWVEDTGINYLNRELGRSA